MGFHEDHFILNLKSQFYDIFVEDDGLYQIDRIMEKMIFIIKTLTDVEEVTIFTKNECKKEAFFVMSTNPNYKLGMVPINENFVKCLESVKSNALYCQFKPIKDMNLTRFIASIKTKRKYDELHLIKRE